MATRRILVFDNDSHFLELLQNSLGAYGFEVHAAAPGPGDIQKLEALGPEIIFIAVDLPDKAGFSLCSKARKIVGRKIPIVLVTATLSPHDIALHGIQRLHADAYMDKRSLSRDELLHKLDELIRLVPHTGPIRPEGDEGLRPADDANHISREEDETGLFNGAAAEAHETAGAAGREELAGGQPDSILEISEDLSEPSVSDRTDAMDEPMTKKDGNGSGSGDLNRRLAKRESEILRLRQQLEETRRDARSSPFSSDFLKLRERVDQKDLEIAFLTEKLNESKRKIIAYKKESRVLSQSITELQQEIARGLKREEDLETLKQRATIEVQVISEMLTKEREAHQETQRHVESRIAELQDRHAVAMKQAEQDTQSTLESLREHIQGEVGRTEEKSKHDLKALEEKFAAQIAKLQSEKNDEIEAVKQKAGEEARRAAESLVREQEAHQETRRHFESRVAELQDQHAAAVKQAEQEKHAALQSVREQIQGEVAGAEEKRKHDLQALEEKFSARIDKLQSEKNDEIETVNQKASAEVRQAAEKLAREQEAHQETRHHFESRIEELRNKQAAAVKQVEQEKQAALESIRQQLDERQKGELQALEKKYKEQINQLQAENNIKILEIRQQTNEMLSKEKETHHKIRAYYESKITQLTSQPREASRAAPSADVSPKGNAQDLSSQATQARPPILPKEVKRPDHLDPSEKK